MPRDRVKILLVDDRPENLLALEAILQSLDEEMVRATSGEEALKKLLVDDFAVILLDVQMPGLDGYETAEHIKRRQRTKNVPIIFLTAINAEPQHAFQGYAAGAVDYIAKPFDPWVLRAKVSVFVEMHRTNLRLREQADMLRAHLAAAGGAPGGQSVADELSARLAGVEEQLELLQEQARVSIDRVMVDGIAELGERVARLRAVLDMLGASRRG